MEAPNFHDHETAFEVSGRQRKLLVRTPTRLAEKPALYFALAADRRRCFAEPAYRPLFEPLLRAGHRLASLDLPNHGDLIDRYGEGLTGMRAAVADGVDVFASLVATGRAAVGVCLERGWGQAGRIGIAGISRGAICALNWLAEDSRVVAVAAFAPVTYLPALQEFAQLGDSPIVRRRNAVALAPSLVGRSIFLIIGKNDPRVGTDNSRQVVDLLCGSAPEISNVVFHLTEGNDHSLPPDAYRRGAQWLIETVGISVD